MRTRDSKNGDEEEKEQKHINDWSHAIENLP